jgi:hypothetical protein
MGKLMDLLRSPATPSREALEEVLLELVKADMALDEVAFLRVQNAELMALVKRYQEDDGRVTAEIARAHAESEFEKYRIIQDRLYASDFDRLLGITEEVVDDDEPPAPSRPKP